VLQCGMLDKLVVVCCKIELLWPRGGPVILQWDWVTKSNFYAGG
jgi:hypothetical protein